MATSKKMFALAVVAAACAAVADAQFVASKRCTSDISCAINTIRFSGGKCVNGRCKYTARASTAKPDLATKPAGKPTSTARPPSTKQSTCDKYPKCQSDRDCVGNVVDGEQRPSCRNFVTRNDLLSKTLRFCQVGSRDKVCLRADSTKPSGSTTPRTTAGPTKTGTWGLGPNCGFSCKCTTDKDCVGKLKGVDESPKYRAACRLVKGRGLCYAATVKSSTKPSSTKRPGKGGPANCRSDNDCTGKTVLGRDASSCTKTAGGQVCMPPGPTQKATIATKPSGGRQCRRDEDCESRKCVKANSKFALGTCSTATGSTGNTAPTGDRTTPTFATRPSAARCMNDQMCRGGKCVMPAGSRTGQCSTPPGRTTPAGRTTLPRQAGCTSNADCAGKADGQGARSADAFTHSHPAATRRHAVPAAAAAAARVASRDRQLPDPLRE